MSILTRISSILDIPAKYIKTPAGLLLEYHNLERSRENYTQPELLICTCMDSRINLRIPDNFAFVIRTGGADMTGNEFKMAYALAVAKIKCIANIGHSDCGMVNLESRKVQFIEGLEYYAGWGRQEAEEFFNENSREYEIMNETGFILKQTKELRKLFPKITVAPMLYKVEDNRLYLIDEN